MQLDEQTQYSHGNCLLFHGIKEEKGEDTNSIIKHRALINSTLIEHSQYIFIKTFQEMLQAISQVATRKEHSSKICKFPKKTTEAATGNVL